MEHVYAAFLEMTHLNSSGVVVGIVTLISIALGHVLVVESVKRFGVRAWMGFLGVGLLFLVLSLLSGSDVMSAIFGANSFIFLWGVYEVFKYHEKLEEQRRN